MVPARPFFIGRPGWVGQGADLLETRGWDDLAGGVIEAWYSWSSSFLTAAIWRSSNSVNRRPRQRSAARMSAPNMSLSTGFSPKPLGWRADRGKIPWGG